MILVIVEMGTMIMEPRNVLIVMKVVLLVVLEDSVVVECVRLGIDLMGFLEIA